MSSSSHFLIGLAVVDRLISRRLLSYNGLGWTRIQPNFLGLGDLIVWYVDVGNGLADIVWNIGHDHNGIFWLSVAGEPRRDFADFPDLLDSLEALQDALGLTPKC
jgi:hypothetical protein